MLMWRVVTSIAYIGPLVLPKGRSQDITRLVIECGADIGNRNAEGKTPLHTFFNPAIASIIIRHPESVNEAIACDNGGMTILHYIAFNIYGLTRAALAHRSGLHAVAEYLD